MTLQENQTKEQLGKALGRIASGVFIVTTQVKEQKHGLLATWISQASFEPPGVTLAFNKQRGILSQLAPGDAITINILSKANMDVFKAFAKPAGPQKDDRFDGLELLDNTEGGPVFSKSVAFLNCRIKQFVEAGDHLVALAEVFSGRQLDAESEPMVHLRNNGFQY